MKEKAIWALGTMSGTSLDGVDAAMILTDGQDVLEFGPSAYRAYTAREQSVLRAALGAWPGDEGVAEAAAVVEAAHIELLQGLTGAELIGFHGQTLAHDPSGRGTHQAGDGAALAEALGIPVVWDLRSADVAAGGQGAPLAPAYHFALARAIGADQPVSFLNLGGVGNLTWIDPARRDPFETGAMLAFDTGPANAPLNDLMRSRFGLECDRDGVLARDGKPDEAVLERFLSHPFFSLSPPKSLDRDAFSSLGTDVAALSDADAAATLVEAAVRGVVAAVELCAAPPSSVLVTGGGRRNPVLMAGLSRLLTCRVGPVEDVGLDGDMLEAQAFAYLAVRCQRDQPISGPDTTRVPFALSGGKVAHPSTQRVGRRRA